VWAGSARSREFSMQPDSDRTGAEHKKLQCSIYCSLASQMRLRFNSLCDRLAATQHAPAHKQRPTSRLPSPGGDDDHEP
jgi:hypothetical protein